MVICLTLICIHTARREQCAALKITFHSCTALLHLSCSHLCADTMTVGWHLFALLRDNNSNSAKRAGLLSGRSPPGASRALPEASLSTPPPDAPHLTLCLPRSGHKVLSYSHQTVWLEAAADATVFLFGFVSSLFSLPSILSALAAEALWRVSF